MKRTLITSTVLCGMLNSAMCGTVARWDFNTYRFRRRCLDRHKVALCWNRGGLLRGRERRGF